MSISVSPYNPVQQAGVRAKNPPDLVIATRGPASTDYGFFLGTLWLDSDANAIWALGSLSISPSSKSATWVLLGGSSSDVNTLTGNSGGAISPTGGNINTLGAGSITIAGSGSTLTTQLTGMTNHAVLVGAGTTTLTKVAPSATSGIPLVSNGAAADPSFTTAVVAGGGTGVTSATAYAVICGGTTATGALQPLASVGTAGQVLTSNGAAALPTWQNGGSILTVTQVNNAASPYTVLSTDQFIAVDCSGGAVTIRLPNAPTTGRTIFVKDASGDAFANNITVTTVGGVVNIDGSATHPLNVNYQSTSVIFDGTEYLVF